MKDAKTILLSDKIFFWSFIIISACNLAMLGILGFFYRSFPPLVPLYNQMPWGEQRLVSTPFIFLPFGISLILLVVNFTSAFIIYTKFPLLARILAITSFLTTVLSLLLTIRTVQLIV